jgi:endonuclease/exonuclease/phosphatase family metal-dependent hydrolase
VTEETQNKPGIKLVDLNIEHEKHLDLVIPFLIKAAADVVCLQEVYQEDLSRIADTLGMHSYYAPSRTHTRNTPDSKPELEGVAILSKNPLNDVRKDYYQTHGREPGDVVQFSQLLANETTQKVLLSGLVNTNEGEIRIGTTHFTWTPDGLASEQQRQDIKLLLDVLSNFKNIAFCGDFNAPRGREIFTVLSDAYHDNVPGNIVSTIDPELHKTKGLRYVVDSIFTSANYAVNDVEVISGVSDHCAVIGRVSLLTNPVNYSTPLDAGDNLAVV